MEETLNLKWGNSFIKIENGTMEIKHKGSFFLDGILGGKSTNEIIKDKIENFSLVYFKITMKRNVNIVINHKNSDKKFIIWIFAKENEICNYIKLRDIMSNHGMYENVSTLDFLNGKDKTKRSKDNVEENRKEEKLYEIKAEKPKERIYISHMDAYFWEAGRFVIEKDKGSIGMIQRQFRIGFNRASKIMDELYEAGVVGEELGTAPRKILMSYDEFEELFYEDNIYPKTCYKDLKEERIGMYNNKIDYMTGEDFELYVAQMLGNIGFYNIQTTKGSGDQGVDILAEKEGMKYAFQCKRYDKPVGNKAVQEVFAGKFFYHCHVAIVVTNNYFTQSAKDLAHENGVVLWDRDYLQKFIGATNKPLTEADALREYNENRKEGELRILDIDEKIIAVEDGELSKYLYQYLEAASRIAIDMYLENGDGNPYTEDMIRNVEKPIFLYNIKCLKLTKYVLNFTYYCRMNPNYKSTQSYYKTLEIYKNNGNECEHDLFNISVYYNVEDILFEIKEVKVDKIPEVNIMADDMETIEQLENIDEYDLQTGYKHLVTENFFPMKIDNMKFE